jgi:hypothetical protein
MARTLAGGFSSKSSARWNRQLLPVWQAHELRRPSARLNAKGRDLFTDMNGPNFVARSNWRRMSCFAPFYVSAELSCLRDKRGGDELFQQSGAESKTRLHLSLAARHTHAQLGDEARLFPLVCRLALAAQARRVLHFDEPLPGKRS